MAGIVVHVVGARPNFIKAAPVIHALRALGVAQRLIHTGQHYDAALSDVFFTRPRRCRSRTSTWASARVARRPRRRPSWSRSEAAFVELRPALVVVYGDVNSTLAAALVAAKLRIPLAHVEAGLRSFDDDDARGDQPAGHGPALRPAVRDQPGGRRQPRARGRRPRSDPLRRQPHDRHAARQPRPLRRRGRCGRALGLAGPYAVATLHRPANVDEPAQAAAGSSAMLRDVAEPAPAGRSRSTRAAGPCSRPPASSPATGCASSSRSATSTFLSLVRGAALVVTDSGGIQEETTILRRPVPDRPPEHGAADHDHPRHQPPGRAGGRRRRPPRSLRGRRPRVPATGPPLWDGHAGERIAAIIEAWLGTRIG